MLTLWEALSLNLEYHHSLDECPDVANCPDHRESSKTELEEFELPF